MPSLSGLSFNWVFLIVGIIIFIYGLRAFLGYRNVARDAEDDYQYKVKNGMDDPRLTKEAYIRAYKRFYNPRGPLYVAGTLLVMVLLTPIIMIIIQFLLEQLYQFSGRSRVFEPGYLVWQFFIFFLMIMSWAFTTYLGARRYYKYAPATLAQEMDLEAETIQAFDS
jgi:amino acid transporter